MIAFPDWGSLGVFVRPPPSCFSITPGPAVLYIVARSVRPGEKGGPRVGAGHRRGNARARRRRRRSASRSLLAASATLYGVVKYLGAAYLVYLGVRRLARVGSAAARARPRSRAIAWRRAFLQGAVVNVLNPKTALFFLAFLPQFVEPARRPVALQVMALGLLFVGMATCTDSSYAVAAGSARRFILAASPRFMTGQRWVTGGMYIGLGVAAAFTDARAETGASGVTGRASA